jgi:hypothetical protein
MITFGEEGGTATPPCFESGAGTLALWLSGPPLASGTKKYGWITRDECCMPDARCCLQGRKDGVYSGRKAEVKRGEVRGLKNCAKRATLSLVAGYL